MAVRVTIFFPEVSLTNKLKLSDHNLKRLTLIFHRHSFTTTAAHKYFTDHYHGRHKNPFAENRQKQNNRWNGQQYVHLTKNIFLFLRKILEWVDMESLRHE
jgi:hypothetical protein